MKKLTEIYGLNEGPFDDVQNQLNGAQSLRGGPTSTDNVRKHQDRAKRWDKDVAKAQSDIDSAKSVFGEAAGEHQVCPAHDHSDLMAGEYREYEGAQELIDKLEAAQNGGMASSSSSSHTSMKRTPFG